MTKIVTKIFDEANKGKDVDYYYDDLTDNDFTPLSVRWGKIKPEGVDALKVDSVWLAVGFTQDGGGCNTSTNYAVTRGFIDVTEKCRPQPFWFTEEASEPIVSHISEGKETVRLEWLQNRKETCKAKTFAYLPTKTFGPTKYRNNAVCYTMEWKNETNATNSTEAD